MSPFLSSGRLFYAAFYPTGSQALSKTLGRNSGIGNTEQSCVRTLQTPQDKPPQKKHARSFDNLVQINIPYFLPDLLCPVTMQDTLD